MSETPAVDRPLPRESDRAFARFKHYAEQGPTRQLKITAQAFGVAVSTVSEQASRFDWHRRAALWDAEHAAADRERSAAATAAAVLAPVTAAAGEGHDLDAEHLRALEEFRGEMESTGKGQVRLARGLAGAAARSAARLAAGDLAPRDIAQLAAVAATLASSGAALWGQSIGATRLIAAMEAAQQLEIID
jgi:hypothetical protein